MKKAVISLTQNGADLAVKLGSSIEADIYVKSEYASHYGSLYKGCSIHPVGEIFGDFVGSLFESCDALVFIMACGIVVRSIAPYIKDKRTDPAVVVLDEKGKFVISLLSGHIGGANALAGEISLVTGGTPVITTATDVNDTVAFDVFAKQNDCIIENFEELKYISSELVNNNKVYFYCDHDIQGDLPENLIKLKGSGCIDKENAVVLSSKTDFEVSSRKAVFIRPRNLILGIGCRKGILKENVEVAVRDFMDKNKRSMASIKCLATIELKKDEQGLLEFCREHGLYLSTVSTDRVKEVEDSYTRSEFVKGKVGVSSVAEPCAVLSGKNARLICKKKVYRGITLALSEEEKVFRI
ncbi:MAG: cobalt-precorrin 5A hydrolase [Bacillota bacterium]